MKIGSVGNVNPVTNNVSKVESAPMPHSTVAQVGSTSKPAVQDIGDSKFRSNEGSGVREDEDVVEQSVDQANQTLKMYDRRIDRVIHPETKAVIYTIKDTKTNEVIAEFPSKKIQDMMAKMWELAGMFVDDKA